MESKLTALLRTEKQEFDTDTTERATIIKHSLYAVYYQNRWPVVDLRQIISRLTMLQQKRCVVAVLEKNDIGYKILHHTCFDPFWKNDFEGYIKNKLYKKCIRKDSKDLIIIDGEKLKSLGIEVNNRNHHIRDFLIQFHENKYFILHEILSSKDGNPSAEDKREFPPILIQEKNPEDIKSSLLSCLSDQLLVDLNESFRIKRIFESKELQNTLSEKERDWENQQLLRSLPTERLDLYWDNIKEYKEEKKQDFFDEHFKNIRGIFDLEYRKFRNSPLLRNDDCSPNIFFFLRSFNQDKLRFHNFYPYSVRIIIPDSQKDDLIEVFESLSRSSGKWPILKDVNGIDIDDSFFWNNIKSDNFEEIFDSLEKPNELYARSMSDSVFESGYINIKKGPFAFGGESRLEKHELDKKGESRGYRRSVYFHYLLATALAPRSYNPSNNSNPISNFSTLLVPGIIGGSPFFCSGFVFNHIKDTPIPRQVWLDNHHFYQMCHYLRLSIRSNLMELYLLEIREIYENQQDAILDKIISNEVFLKNEVCKLLNPKFGMLSRVYPYGLVELDTDTGEKDEILKFSIYYAGGNVEFTVRIKNNPFFINQIAKNRFSGSKKIKESLIIANKNLENKLIEKNMLFRAQIKGV